MSKQKKETKMTLKQYAENVIQDGIEKAVKKLPDRVREQIDKIIWELIGVRQWGGRPEVDRRSDQYNLIVEIIKAEAQKDLVEAIKNLKIKVDVQQFREAFHAEYMSHFKYYLKWHAKKKAEIIAEKMVNQIVEDETNKLTKMKISLPKKSDDDIPF